MTYGWSLRVQARSKEFVASRQTGKKGQFKPLNISGKLAAVLLLQLLLLLLYAYMHSYPKSAFRPLRAYLTPPSEAA